MAVLSWTRGATSIVMKGIEVYKDVRFGLRTFHALKHKRASEQREARISAHSMSKGVSHQQTAAFEISAVFKCKRAAWSRRGARIF